MGYYKIGRSVLVSLLVVLSASFVPSLPMILMTSRVLAETVDARKAEADRLFKQGEQSFQANQVEIALQYFQKALVLYQNIKNRRGECETLLNLGLVYEKVQDYPKAIDYYKKSLVIGWEFKDIGLQWLIQLMLGEAQNRIYPQKKEADKFLMLASLHFQRGEFKTSLVFSEQALKIYRQIKNRHSEAKGLSSLGVFYNYIGDYKKAINFHRQSLAIFKQIGDRVSLGNELNNLGVAYSQLGNYVKAIDFYQQSLIIAKEFNIGISIAVTLTNIGEGYYFLGNYKKAIDFHQQSLTILKKMGFNSLKGGLPFDNLKAYALNNLGIVYASLKDYKTAIKLQQQSLVIAKETSDRRVEGEALNDLGHAFFKSGNLVKAENVLKQAIEVHKSQRGRLENRDDFKISIFEEQARTYLTLQQVLIAQNKNDAALEVAESGRARAFVDLLTSRLSPNDDISSATEPTINQIKQIAKAQNSTLVQYSIIIDEFKIAGKHQAKESELYIWVIKPTGEVTFRKADLKPLWQKENTTLDELVTTSRQSIGARGAAFRGIDVSFNPDAPKATNKLKRLHELLINPIADLLPKNPSARVTFIPQSSLFLVPFPALQDASGKYLIEKHTILTSPSIQVLELTREKRQQIRQRMGEGQRMGNNMLIVGNPTMPKIPPKIGEAPQQLSPLPGAEREAKAIAKLFGAKPLIGNEATETKVTQRLPQARLIHLATHGLFDNVQGLNSGIALATGGNQNSDGLLTAGEILDLKLNAELVVLSACDTGRGRISGDGVIGLSRSLISAGVPSVLVSLWSVPDAPTAELMTEFYQNIQNNPDKAQALRQAMLKIMKQHPNPRDWAAFTLIGEAE